MSPTSYQAAPPRIKPADHRAGPGACQAGRARVSEGRRGCRGAARARSSPLPAIDVRPSGCAVGACWLCCALPTGQAPCSDRVRPHSRRSALIRPWLRAVPGLVALTLVAGGAHLARAAAEVHRFNLVLNAIPTSIAGGDFNDVTIKAINANLNNRGLETLDNISYGWMFGAE